MHAYVNFGGQCAEAFRFYEKHLGGKIGAASIRVRAPHRRGVKQRMACIAEVYSDVRVDPMSHAQSDRAVSGKVQDDWSRNELLLESLEFFVRQHAVLVTGRRCNRIPVSSYALSYRPPPWILTLQNAYRRNQEQNHAYERADA